MFEVSSKVAELLKKNYRQVISIIVHQDDKTYELNESNILQGGFTVDRYCVSGNNIEIGSAIASEITLKLDNRNDRFKDEILEGAELEIKVGVKKWDAYRWEKAEIEWIPCGYFTVDEQPRKLSNISLTALDRMVRFDIPVSETDISFPISIGNLLRICCIQCNVQLETNASELLNNDYIVENYPDETDLTYRQLIQWIAEITGTCAFIDWNGKLRLEWYKDTDVVITPSDRYSSQTDENEITITGVKITNIDDEEFLAGTDDYAFNIENNSLIQHDFQIIANALNQKLGGFTYLPFESMTKPMPYIFPLDIVNFVDKNKVSHNCIITNVTFTLNQKTSISGKGETNTKRSYASANPLTKGESIALKKTEQKVSKEISRSEQSLIELNGTIANSFGLYQTVIKNGNSNNFYFHDKPTLETSTIVYTFMANGFAWTNEWNDSSTQWTYGLTKEGNAILNLLNVYKLTATQIDTESLLVGKDFNDGIVEIVRGTVTANYITALGLTAQSLEITNQAGKKIFIAKDNIVKIGDFEVDTKGTDSYISKSKKAYNDNINGVYVGTDGIGLGQGSFYVTQDGTINATKGNIGSWVITNGILHSTSGEYGTYRCDTGGLFVLVTVTGWAFAALTSTGLSYIVKQTNDFESETLAIISGSSSHKYTGSVTDPTDPGGGTVLF